MASVVIVCVSLRAGGAERIVSMLANYLVARHEVNIILLTTAEPFYSLDPRVSVLRPAKRSKKKHWWSYYPAMFAYFRGHVGKIKPNFVLSFGETINPFVLLSLVFINADKYVFNRASPLSSLRGRRSILNPIIYPLADAIVVQTNRARELLQSSYRFNRIDVIPNPVQFRRNVPALENRAKTIVNVGYLGGNKNQDALIRIFSGCEGSEEWRIHFIGEGPAKNRLEKLARELRVEDRVQFLGERSDVEDQLHNAQIFAFTSLTEGFPNALAEALAAGCACISYDCPTGPSELIKDGYNGLLVALNDEGAFVKGLTALMNDSNLRERFSKHARKDIRRFDAARVFPLFERLISDT